MKKENKEKTSNKLIQRRLAAAAVHFEESFRGIAHALEVLKHAEEIMENT